MVGDSLMLRMIREESWALGIRTVYAPVRIYEVDGSSERYAVWMYEDKTERGLLRVIDTKTGRSAIKDLSDDIEDLDWNLTRENIDEYLADVIEETIENFAIHARSRRPKD